MDGGVAAGPKPRRSASRRRFTLTLDESLIARARAVTPDLSGLVERVLTDHVVRLERRRMDDTELQRVIDALDAHHRAHGLLSDEFPSL